MASVSSLDQDVRKLRLDRYTPAAANEIRRWIEEVLGEKLAPGDLMEALRDGVALCRLINLCVSPGVRYKASSMPFVQMENISHFLKACETAPLSLPAHDRFLTVDLFDQKDPTQVLQCIAAFSRRANQVNPTNFPTTIGAKSKGGAMSPESTGGPKGYAINDLPPKHEPHTAFNPLNKAAYSTGGRASPTKQSSLSRGGLATGSPISSWSKPDDENKTAPAWNIHQYGYMGGASQGNQGVAFGARRQITSQAPEVPSVAEKEKRLREQAEKQRRDAEEEQKRQREAQEKEERRAQQEEERRAQQEEERRWEEQTRQLKKQAQEEEERERRLELERQAEEEKERESVMRNKREKQRQSSDSRLNGQFLSQYRASQEIVPTRSTIDSQPAAEIQKQPTAESQRIADLERQLAEAKEVERRYQEKERQRLEEAQQHVHEKQRLEEEHARKATQTKPQSTSKSEVQTSHEDDWDSSERDFLKKQWQMTKQIETEERRPLPAPRPTNTEPATSRPLPEPTEPYQPGTNRTDRYLAKNPAPHPASVRSNRPVDFSTTTEVDLESQRRAASQTKTKAGGWASKSLLEREMERERERQREWEENQKDTASRAKDVQEGSGPGQTWDVHQYGFLGGDSQNRGGTGLGTSGARRQIIGPRPLP